MKKLLRHEDVDPKVVNAAEEVVAAAEEVVPADDQPNKVPQEMLHQVLRNRADRHRIQTATMKNGLLVADAAVEAGGAGGMTKTEIKRITSLPNQTISICNRPAR